MLFPFFKHAEQNKSYAVFCIDGSSVTFTVLERDKNSKEHISHVSKVSLEVTSSKDVTSRLRSINTSFDKIFEGIKQNRLFDLIKSTTQIFVLVGSPWHIAWNDEIKIDKEKKFKVTKRIINDSINNSFSMTHGDLKITDVNVMGYRLNGYTMSNPLGKVTSCLDLRVYISSAPKQFIELVESKIKSHITHNKITFSSYNNALYQSILANTEEGNCIILLPENETTEVVLVRNAEIISEASLPFGNVVLAQDLFGAKSSSIKESLLKTKRFVEGTLDIPDLDVVGKKIEKTQDVFLSNFRDIVWKMGDTMILPGNIFIVGKNLATHFIIDWVSKDDYIKKTFTLDDYKIINLRGNDIIYNKYLNGLFHKKTVPVGVAVSTQFIVKK